MGRAGYVSAGCAEFSATKPHCSTNARQAVMIMARGLATLRGHTNCCLAGWGHCRRAKRHALWVGCCGNSDAAIRTRKCRDHENPNCHSGLPAFPDGSSRRRTTPIWSTRSTSNRAFKEDWSSNWGLSTPSSPPGWAVGTRSHSKLSIPIRNELPVEESTRSPRSVRQDHSRTIRRQEAALRRQPGQPDRLA